MGQLFYLCAIATGQHWLTVVDYDDATTVKKPILNCLDSKRVERGQKLWLIGCHLIVFLHILYMCHHLQQE
jgi:hypothetical protein